MKPFLVVLLPFQRFFMPALLALVAWAIWRTVWRKDLGVGLGLYLGLVVIVDGFLNTGIFLPGLEKGSIHYSEVCAAFLLWNRPPASSRQPPYLAVCVLVSLYFTLLLFSAFRTNSMLAGIFDYRRIIVPQVISFLVAVRGFREPGELRRFFLCLMLLSLIVGVFIFWDLFFDRWLIHSDSLYRPEYGVNRSHGRYGSFFLNPNYLGAFVVLVFPSAFVLTLSEKAKRKACAALGMLSLVFCLVETQSRGPLLAFGMLLPLLMFGPAGEVSRRKRVGMFLPFVLLLVLVMPGFFEHAAERFDEIDQEMSTDSARTRQTIWGYTKRAISDHPLAGIGFGERQFVSVIDTYGFSDKYGEQSLDNPHNSYLQMTVYGGIPVLLCFVFGNLLLIARAARSVARRSLTNGRTPIAFALLVGLVAYLVVIYPDMHMFTQTVAPVYWVLFALLLSLTAPVVEKKPAANDMYDGIRASIRDMPRLAGHSVAVASHSGRGRYGATGARGDDRPAVTDTLPRYGRSR